MTVPCCEQWTRHMGRQLDVDDNLCSCLRSDTAVKSACNALPFSWFSNIVPVLYRFN